MNASDSAEELVRIYLEGVGFTLKIAGEGSKNLIAFLIALSKDNTQTKGKSRITNMIKTGKELKIFTLKENDLKNFSKLAKKYGILYCVLANRKMDKIDGVVDIMVRQEDAAKINRLVERCGFEKVDIATIEKEEINISNETIDTKENTPSNYKSGGKNQLENSLNFKNKLEVDKNEKVSVKKQLSKIENELNKKENMQKKAYSKNNKNINYSYKNKRKNKIRERGK